MGHAENPDEDERDAIALRARLIREARRREIEKKAGRCAGCGNQARERPSGVGRDLYCEACLLRQAKARREKRGWRARP